MRKNKRRTISIDDDLWDDLRIHAIKTKRSVNNVIEDVLYAFLKKEHLMRKQTNPIINDVTKPIDERLKALTES
jgi:predicted CopG family antitoxin